MAHFPKALPPCCVTCNFHTVYGSIIHAHLLETGAIVPLFDFKVVGMG